MSSALSDTPAATTATAERTLGIAIQLQDALETWYLTRTLQTGAHMAGIALRFEVPPEAADLLIVAPSEAAAVALLQQRQGHAVPVAYSAAEVPGMLWLPRPARTRDARKLLEAAEDRRRHRAEGPRAPGTLALPFQVADAQELLLLLKRGIARREPFLIGVNLGFSLVVLPRLDKVCSPIEVGPGEIGASLREVRLADMRALTEAEAAKRMVETHRHGLPLSALAWEVALQATPLSAARPLLEGLHLRLRERPDFAVLPARPEHLRWSELLLGRSFSLAELVTYSPDGLAPVARFANACSVLGLLEFVAPDAGQ